MTTITGEQVEIVLQRAEAKGTATAYRRQLVLFADWLGERLFDYDALIEFRAHLRDVGKSPQNINQALAAIRFYAQDAVNRDWLTPEILARLKQVDALRITGRAIGNWLTIEEAQNLLNVPLSSTAIGLRDRAMLALLIGAGLRRSELCALHVRHFEQRDGGEGRKRWLLVGVTGKGGKTRNIPIADWVKAIVDRWLDRTRIRGGFVFRTVRETPFKIGASGVSPALVYKIVSIYGSKIGRPGLAPHDLRRTFARLAFEGKSPMTEIQQSLGHGSVAVTERYVNAVQDILIAPGDVLGIIIQ